ncbi:MAG: TonB-dependent receptor plug domain-containing protein [Terrimonas sp.]|nr:TonB-dependent receptor plug domain-containing protein [Terrimonas sp.]
MKKITRPIFKHLLLLSCFCGILAPGLLAQQATLHGPLNNNIFKTPKNFVYQRIPYRPERRLDIKSANPVTSIGAEEINQTYSLSGKNLEQIVHLTPGGVLKSVNTNINIRGVGNIQQTMTNYTMYTADHQPVYSQTQIMDVNKIPIEAIEQIEVLKNGAGVTYGSDARSGVINFNTRKGLDTRYLKGIYVPYYTPPVQHFSGLKNDIKSDWDSYMDALKSNGPSNTTKADQTFGSNGKIIISIVTNNDFWIVDKKYLDANNILRMQEDNEMYPENYASLQTTYFDCTGKPEFLKLDMKDQYGYNINQLRVNYADGNLYYGYYSPDAQLASPFRQYYKTEDQQFHLNTDLGGALIKDKLFYNYSYSPNMSACKEQKTETGLPKHVVTFGLSYRLEDFGMDKKGFIGPTVSYTHFYNPWLGSTVDAGFNFGKAFNTKYSIGSFFAGPTFVPFTNSHGLNNNFTLSAHTLAGYTRITQKYMSNSYSDGAFSLKLGAALDYNIKDNFGIRAGADDNMVLGDGNTSNNWAFHVGVKFSMR